MIRHSEITKWPHYNTVIAGHGTISGTTNAQFDLKADSRELYLSLGEEKTAELFVRLKPGENPDFPDGHDDKTHFNPFGARKICALVVREMSAYPVCAAYLREDALSLADAVLKEGAQ